MDRDAFGRTDGATVTAVTAEEMRAVDRVAVETFGIELLQLMEHAGRTLAGRVRERTAGPVTVVAGNGGNGGGGLCAARHLVNRGVAVTVVLDRRPAELDGAPAHHLATLEQMGVPVDSGADAVAATDPDLVVDALVGYGLDGPLRGTAADIVESVAAIDAPIVSLDVPSGVDATTGEDYGGLSPAEVVTLALPKTGLATLACPVVLADIGIPAGVYDRLDIPYRSPFGRDYWLELVRTAP